MIKKYRKKPVEIEAVQWTGYNIKEIADFTEGNMAITEDNLLCIFTLEGIHLALVGDYVIKGIKGEFYPCKPDIFEQTYEER